VVEPSDINEEIKMNKRGLASPTKSPDDILSQTRKAFGKSTGKPKSLEKRLQSLPESELNMVLQTAQFVKLSNSFGKPQPYQVTVDSMYPKLNSGIRSLVAEVLEDAEALDLPDNRAEERDKIQQATLDSYAQDVPINMPGKVVGTGRIDDVKAEQLQTAILKKLKVL
jgi:hypothetical protein